VNERAYVVVAVVAAAVLALVLAIYLLSGNGATTASDDGAFEDEESEELAFEDEDDWFGDSEDARDEGGGGSGDDEWRPRPKMDDGWRMGGGGMGKAWRRRRDGGVPDPDRAARRARRRERFISRIEIVALGPGESATTSEAVFDGFREVRPLVRDCLRASGIGRGSWRTMRATDRTMTFDLDSEGAVLPESVSIEPPPPEPFAGCFASGLEVLTTEPPGGEGARVSIDFPARRPRDGGPRER